MLENNCDAKRVRKVLKVYKGEKCERRKIDNKNHRLRGRNFGKVVQLYPRESWSIIYSCFLHTQRFSPGCLKRKCHNEIVFILPPIRPQHLQIKTGWIVFAFFTFSLALICSPSRFEFLRWMNDEITKSDDEMELDWSQRKRPPSLAPWCNHDIIIRMTSRRLHLWCEFSFCGVM